jgi:hypothetical protein
LVGVEGFTVTGDLAARVNTTGGAVNKTITLPNGETVPVIFASTEAAAVFKGTVTASAGGFASVSGGFSISKSTDRLTVAAAGVTAFVGAGGTGLQVSDGNLGVIVNTASKKFALVAGGTISLVGITGFSVSGGGSVRINKLGSSLNETLSTPAGDVVLNFPTTADVLELQGSVSLAVGDFITGSATLAVQKENSADLTTLLVKASAGHCVSWNRLQHG